ncbi:hypothetical protein D9757_002634 [Collybiopsis confluens]|uniref:SWR1-complex protein 4 n=1 Tax=Collybiopsis confluens TaxID=2823264 RepID=A0A8H5HW99_9AGAR|nr:hypothetical protein D9757_002634 [Collybiopsis confluens]
MATAADVRSILSIPSTSIAGPSQPRKPSVSVNRKPEGISRELYSLIGPSAPALAAQLAKPRLKQKPNLGGGGKVKWEWRKFRNSARSDSLELSHWVKASQDADAEYKFAKYDKKPTVYQWSQDEYSRHLEDSDWTKEETEYLFKIANEYDLRWYIIHDRYEYPNGRERELEDLKDRYYSVCRKLIRNRTWAGDEASRNALLLSFHYDKERETIRRKYVASLANRTPDQIQEEEALYVELKRLEQNERQFKKDRENLLRTLAGIDSGLPDIVEDDASLIINDPKKKRFKGDIDVPQTPILTAPVMKRPPAVNKNAVYDATHCIIRNDPPSNAPATKVAHTPAFMRSFKIPYPKAAIAPKVNSLLTELGVSGSRLVMPTQANCQHLESVMDAAMNLVELKKVLDKVNQDIEVLKARLELKDDMRDSASVADGMEEAESENRRSRSVTSGRGRKSVECILDLLLCYPNYFLRVVVQCLSLLLIPLSPLPQGGQESGKNARSLSYTGIIRCCMQLLLEVTIFDVELATCSAEKVLRFGLHWLYS